MKIKELVNGLRKEYVYQCYCRFVDCPKEYKKITKVKMVEEVYDYYKEDIRNLFCMIDKEEYKLLKEIVVEKKKVEFSVDVYRKEMDSLQEKSLLFLSRKGVYEIPEEAYSFIQLLMDTYKEEDFDEKDSNNELIIGIIRAFGLLPLPLLINVFQSYVDMSEKEVFYWIDRHRYLRSYYFLYKVEDFILGSIDIYNYAEEIEQGQELFPYSYNLFTEEELRHIGKEKLDDDVVEIEEFLEFIRDWNPYLQQKMIDNLIICAHLNDDPRNFFEYVHQERVYNDLDLEGFEDVFLNAYIHLPSAILKGNSADDYVEMKKFYNPDYDKECDGHLSESDKDDFYEVYLALLEYVNRKYKVCPKVKKIYKMKNNDPQTIIKIRNILFEHREVIDEFIEENPYDFFGDYLDLIEDFKYAKKCNGVIVDYNNGNAIVYSEDKKLYSVLGLTNSISEIIPEEQLPYMSEFVLLPFHDEIIYDGVIAGVPMKLGDHLKESLYSEIDNQEIIFSITPDKQKFS